MKRIAALALSSLLLGHGALAESLFPAWHGYAGNARHTAPAPALGQPLAGLHWKTKVDLDPQLFGGNLYIHYASPMITAANTVIVPVKFGAAGGFLVNALKGATGAELWHQTTDYILPPHSWTPSFPASLTAQNRLYYAGAGGTVFFRDQPDRATGSGGQLAFFGLANYQADKATYDANVMVSTPITADAAGNIYFGFTVIGATKANLASGIARISSNGDGRWISAATAANDAGITEVPTNCAPALSADGTTIYVAVSNGNSGFLLGLDSTDLAPKYKAALKDPSSGRLATLDDQSSAAPTVGPGGDIYYGVLENPNLSHNGRGWLLHFDATLAISRIPGSFGWDDTVSVVPAAAVLSYTGTSTYLLMTKYNNYLGVGPSGDGHNKIAILDPTATEPDPYIPAVAVMKEIETALGPTPYPGSPGAVYEWCINSAVVDATTHSVIANSEDGHVYRWDVATNSLSKGFELNAPQPEAYTPTLIGPDGQLYAINNSYLYALGH